MTLITMSWGEKVGVRRKNKTDECERSDVALWLEVKEAAGVRRSNGATS